MAAEPKAVPTLADLIAYHRAWEADPETGGRARIELPPPGSPRFSYVRYRRDRLAPAARALRDSGIRFQLEQLAAQRGFCTSGGFTTRTAEAIMARLIFVQGIPGDEAARTTLPVVVAFLTTLDDASGAGEGERWLSVRDSARLAGVDVSTVSKAATARALRSNGLKGAKRLIDAVDLARWMKARHARSDRPETDSTVMRKLQRARLE